MANGHTSNFPRCLHCLGWLLFAFSLMWIWAQPFLFYVLCSIGVCLLVVSLVAHLAERKRRQRMEQERATTLDTEEQDGLGVTYVDIGEGGGGEGGDALSSLSTSNGVARLSMYQQNPYSPPYYAQMEPQRSHLYPAAASTSCLLCPDPSSASPPPSPSSAHHHHHYPSYFPSLPPLYQQQPQPQQQQSQQQQPIAPSSGPPSLNPPLKL
ncbi:proline-rich extensin-like protein EPR1 [Balamuthia mandrillaris]